MEQPKPHPVSGQHYWVRTWDGRVLVALYYASQFWVPGSSKPQRDAEVLSGPLPAPETEEKENT